jgi:ketosteroid isomerase-like protein
MTRPAHSDRADVDGSVGAVADRFADAFIRGDSDLLGGLYAAELRFTSHADGSVRNREQALRAFRTLHPQLREVTLEIIDRHVSEHGYTSQQILRCTAPDGTRLTIPHCLVVRVENECITRIDEYLDRSTVAPLLAQIPGVMRPISPPPKENRMFVQLVEGGASPDLRAEMDRIVNEEMLPALDLEPGYAGALNLVDRETGNAMMLTLWNTQEQAELPIRDRGAAFLRALGSIAAISSGQRRPISVWEVNAIHHVALTSRT